MAKDIELIENALDEEVEENGTATIKLSKPFKWEGRVYKELNFDFDSLTGRDADRIDRECQAAGLAVIVPGVTGAYNIRVAANACIEPLGIDAFQAMPLRDYNKAVSAARNFLLVQG